jgi:hypothetical protein
MRLRPDAEAFACRRWLFGVPIGSSASRDAHPPATLVAHVLGREPDANALADAEVRWDSFDVGVYERQCITVRGAISRSIRTVTIPAGAHPHEHHEHH